MKKLITVSSNETLGGSAADRPVTRQVALEALPAPADTVQVLGPGQRHPTQSRLPNQARDVNGLNPAA